MIDKLSWMAIYPEVVLLVMACIIALVDLSTAGARRTRTYILTLLTLAVVAFLTGLNASNGQTVYGFGGMVVSDPMGNWLKCFASIALMVSLVYGRPYAADRGMLRGGEMFTLSMFSLLGMFVMISGSNFLMIYLGLELLTLSSYALVALRRENAVASEAAMKYFVLGAMASGFLLYGLSMMYGATGSLDVNEVFKAIASRKVNHQVLVFGLVFIVAGLAFKVGAAPFHMWVPDVYQGAPTAVTLLIGAAPELAAFAIIIRLLVEGLLPLAIDWQQMLTILAVLSMAIGNITAIAQTNLKRMLAYSTISHMGYLLYGFMSVSANGYASAMFYISSYVIMSLCSFGIILLLSRKGFEAENLDDLKGLNQRSPWFAFLMMITMFSMAGIPPTLGFYAKFTVLQAALQAGYLWLVVFAVLMAVVGAFYYLRIVKLMYFDEPLDNSPIVNHVEMNMVLSVNALGLLALGMMPQRLMEICAYAITRSLQ